MFVDIRLGVPRKYLILKYFDCYSQGKFFVENKFTGKNRGSLFTFSCVLCKINEKHLDVNLTVFYGLLTVSSELILRVSNSASTTNILFYLH